MKLNFVEKRIENKYDNESAMNTLKVMMKRGEQLVVKFFTSKDNFPCAWIESKKISGFKLILNQEGLNKTADFSENEDNDFQLTIFRQLAAHDERRLQFVPLFREKSDSISGYASYMKGKIFFRLTRTTELLDYLIEKDLIA